jgi:hypothetical protein
MTRPRHITLAVAGHVYRVEVVRGVTRASGGAFSEPVDLDHLVDLLLLLDEAGDELRRRTSADVRARRDGGGR